jgi:hypothetical protein
LGKKNEWMTLLHVRSLHEYIEEKKGKRVGPRTWEADHMGLDRVLWARALTTHRVRIAAVLDRVSPPCRHTSL